MSRRCTKRDVLAAEVEWLAGTDDPERIARRLGYASTTNLYRRLHRIGRSDLAHAFMAGRQLVGIERAR